MAKKIVFANLKGGVAKTTSTISVAHALVEMGKRVLLVDCDIQASLSFASGLSPKKLYELEQAGETLYYAMTGKKTIKEVVHYVSDNLHLVPSSVTLLRADKELQSPHGTAHILGKLLKVVEPDYVVILLDTSPYPAMTTINALTYADGVVIPCKAEYYSLLGISLVTDMISETIEKSNPNLKIIGILPTMYHSNTLSDRGILDAFIQLGTAQGINILPAIPHTTKFNLASARMSSIVLEYPETQGAIEYVNLAKIICE